MKKIYYVIFFLVLSVLPIRADLPGFALRDLQGELHRSQDLMQEKLVVLDFWATWCKPCVKSLPHLQHLHETFRDKGLVVVGVNEDGSRSLAKVKPFAASLGLTFPVLLDENQDLVRKLRVNGFPTTFLIHQGEIVLTLQGYRHGDDEKLRAKIIDLLAE